MTSTLHPAATPGSVQHLNPETLHHNPAFTQAVVVSGAVKTVYVGGQNAVDAAGAIVGQGDIAAQTEQVMQNIQAALAAGGASLEHVIKWNVYLIQGQPLQPGFEVFQRVWDRRSTPPAITMAMVAGLANPDFLIEIDAIAVVPLP
ncbi:MAG: RidA family protein [Chloroflexota bacterium]|nr:RidA family protein [Chloroflexota bacterium]